MSMTNSQQTKIYEAERVLTNGRTFTSVADAQMFMNSMRETWWWERFYWNGPAHVEIYFRDGIYSVNHYDRTKDGAVIELSPNGRNVKTLLHELAHVLAAALNSSTTHDPFFARTYGVLVYLMLGSKAWLILQGEFNACGVEYLQTMKEE